VNIDFRIFEEYESQCDLIKEKILSAHTDLSGKSAVAPPLSFDLFLDPVHAINDISRGLAEMHPHKRSIAILGGVPEPLHSVARGFAKSGYSVQEIKVNMLAPYSEQNFSEQIAQLKKDTLFVLGSAIEPITGLIYPWNSVREELLKKSIFLVKYFNAESLLLGHPLPLSELEAFIFNTGTPTLAARGARCKIDPLLWGRSNFLRDQVLRACERFLKSGHYGHHEENYIVDFEKEIQAQDSRVELLPFWQQRVSDRAVFFIKQVNGDAFVKFLLEVAPEFASEITTADSVFWNNPHSPQWMTSLGFSPHHARSSVILSSRILLPNANAEESSKSNVGKNGDSARGGALVEGAARGGAGTSSQKGGAVPARTNVGGAADITTLFASGSSSSTSALSGSALSGSALSGSALSGSALSGSALSGSAPNTPTLNTPPFNTATQLSLKIKTHILSTLKRL
jgi:hypothetical protein